MPHANPNPSPGIDLQQLNARNDRARGIAAYCASAMPALADLWRPVDDALNDAVLLSALVARLSAQVSRLSDELDRARLARANLRAAMRATVTAHADGEPDPLWYLRDELDAPESDPADSRRPKLTSYRQMRRQARLARRGGLQPMMMINTGDGFPETLGVVLARQAWRYRSELAPVGVTAGMVAAAWWLHHTRPHWWPALTVLTGVAAWAVALFGARWRFPAVIERVYAAVTIYAGGIWLSAATAIGPFYKPLLQALVIARASFVNMAVSASKEPGGGSPRR